MRGRDVKHIPQALLAGLFGDKEEHALDEATWQAVMGLPLFEGLDADERMRLRELAMRLLADTDGAVVGGRGTLRARRWL